MTLGTLEIVLILFGGLAAGFINSMAGGGSLLTVPLLSLAGVEGLIANGTNRVAVLIQNGSSGYRYAKSGLVDRRQVARVVAPAVVGGLVGSIVVSQIDDELFERIFGFLMIPLLVLSIRKPKGSKSKGEGSDAVSSAPTEPWPLWLTFVVFFLLGVYAGAIQAGTGIIVLLILSRAGFDLVSGNVLKTAMIFGVSTISVLVFILEGQVQWAPAALLSVGMAIGGYIGANLAVTGGERVVRPVLIVSVIALAGRMIGLD